MFDWRSEVRRRVRELRLSAEREMEIVDEVAQDTEDRYAALLAGGLDPAAAEAQLRDELQRGGWAEALREVRAPAPAPPPVLGESRPGLLADLWLDVRYGLRTLRRQPLFAAAAIATLALGIGASSAMFSVVEAVLLEPLPFPDSDRVVQISGDNPTSGWTDMSLSHPNFWDLFDLQRGFSAVGAVAYGAMSLTGGDFPERIDTAQVTVGFLRALGVAPRVGRLLVEGEDAPGAEHLVAVLSHRFWQARFGGDRAVVDRKLMLDGRPYEVVGVLPP